jgi:hypothetical protein
VNIVKLVAVVPVDKIDHKSFAENWTKGRSNGTTTTMELICPTGDAAMWAGRAIDKVRSLGKIVWGVEGAVWGA